MLGTKVHNLSHRRPGEGPELARSQFSVGEGTLQSREGLLRAEVPVDGSGDRKLDSRRRKSSELAQTANTIQYRSHRYSQQRLEVPVQGLLSEEDIEGRKMRLKEELIKEWRREERMRFEIISNTAKLDTLSKPPITNT